MDGKKGRAKRIIVRVLIALGVIVVAFAIFMGLSVARLMGSVDGLTASYESCQTQMENGDLAGAIASLKDLAKSCEDIKSEVDGWQWQTASHLPVLGDDVQCARGLATIGDSLCNDALIPVLQEAEDVGILDETSLNVLASIIANDDASASGSASGSTGSSAQSTNSSPSTSSSSSTTDSAKPNNALNWFDVVKSLVTIKFDEVDDLIDAIANARVVVGECRKEAEALPFSHFEQLQSASDQITDLLVQTDDILTEVEGIVDGVSSFMSPLFSGGDQPSSEASAS